jgi:hypothetical protein
MSQAYPRDMAFWKHQDRLFLEALDGVRTHPAVRVLFAQLRRVLTDDDDLADAIPEADPSAPLRCEDSHANGVLLDGGEARAAL